MSVGMGVFKGGINRGIGVVLFTVFSARAGALYCTTDGCMLYNTAVLALSAAEKLVQPREVTATNLTLSVKLCTITIPNFASYTARCFCYDGSCGVPGPTIVASPGTTVAVTLTNSLGANPAGATTMNTFHSPNSVNMHTHGLHIDPAIDNIFVELVPGDSHTYLYDVPATHHPGNHWYHSHLHGASTFQVRGAYSWRRRHSSVVGVVAPDVGAAAPDSAEEPRRTATPHRS